MNRGTRHSPNLGPGKEILLTLELSRINIPGLYKSSERLQKDLYFNYYLSDDTHFTGTEIHSG